MSAQVYTFGPFSLDAEQRLLFREDKPVPLGPKLVDILLLLVRNAGRLVEKDELMNQIWPDAFVEEGNLAKNIFVLRQALGNGDGGREYIQTVPKRGYRFVAGVSHSEGQSTAAPQAATEGVASAAPLPLFPTSATPLAVRRWRWAALAFAALLAVAVAGFWLSRPLQPTVLKLIQITRIGRVDPIGRMVTDGARIYFRERSGGRYTLAAVSVNGGEATPVATPFDKTELFDISPDHSDLLIGSASDVSGEYQLWSLPVAGGSPRRLGKFVGYGAGWSHDGKEIAYFSGSGIFVTNTDGPGSRKLANIDGDGWYMRWSPDAKLLRFSSLGSPILTLSLWEVPAAGGAPHRLMSEWREPPTLYGDGESDGDWTGDGKYFVFRSTRAGAAGIWAVAEKHGFLQTSPAPIQLAATDSGLWTLLVSENKIFYSGDKEVRELARFDVASHQFAPYLPGVRARDISFSKDGQWVVYVVANLQQATLWRSKVDGADRRQLTFPTLVAAQPQWSPDGKRIAFVGSQPGNTPRIYLISREGGEPEPVTTSDSLYPAWAPAGDRLIFTAPVPSSTDALRPENSGTYELDLRTRRVLILPGAEALQAVCWSPDGRYLAGVTRDARRLMLFESRGGRWSELAQGGALRPPRWSPESQYVFSQDASESSQPIFRVRVSDLKTERVATFEQILRGDVRNYSLAGITPDGSPVVSFILGYSDIYALDLKLP